MHRIISINPAFIILSKEVFSSIQVLFNQEQLTFSVIVIVNEIIFKSFAAVIV